MERLIDAEKLWRELESTTPDTTIGLDTAIEVIDRQPTVDAAPIVHAHWIDTKHEDGRGEGMTIKELYEWAKEHNCENYPIYWAIEDRYAWSVKDEMEGTDVGEEYSIVRKEGKVIL